MELYFSHLLGWHTKTKKPSSKLGMRVESVTRWGVASCNFAEKWKKVPTQILHSGISVLLAFLNWKCKVPKPWLLIHWVTFITLLWASFFLEKWLLHSSGDWRKPLQLGIGGNQSPITVGFAFLLEQLQQFLVESPICTTTPLQTW